MWNGLQCKAVCLSVGSSYLIGNLFVLRDRKIECTLLNTKILHDCFTYLHGGKARRISSALECHHHHHQPIAVHCWT